MDNYADVEAQMGFETRTINRIRALEQENADLEHRIADLEQHSHRPTMRAVWKLFDNYMKGESND